MTATSDSVASAPPGNLRPILVGYAFGPKKMSTMGIILAEASKAFSTVVTAAVPVSGTGLKEEARLSRCSNPLLAVASPEVTENFPSDEEEADHGLGNDELSIGCVQIKTTNSPRCETERLRCNAKVSVCSEVAHDPSEHFISTATTHRTVDNFSCVSRIVGSSESSAVSVTDSVTSMSPQMAMPQSLSTLPMGKLTPQNPSIRLRPIRVSFVPLDLGSPLEEQHGGTFDAILHKLTEDILCLSKMSSEARRNGSESGRSGVVASESQVHAVQRINRLNQYKLDHPQCCLVDHPSNVQVLMSRSDIAHFLSECLVGVRSASGVPIATPRFEIVESETISIESMSAVVTGAPLRYPLIAKPLAAAGTAESHRMAVVLDRMGLGFVKTPCLLQEYANHDATLFKVYVLGTTVHVFQRTSLPNLPAGNHFKNLKHQNSTSYVEFDSQQPYPTLADFGVTEAGDYLPFIGEPARTRKRRRTCSTFTTKGIPEGESTSPVMDVTADEVLPVVNVLKEAFGLELFGFDILVTESVEQGQDKRRGKQMLVVDVNYFPSYKEVTNFPSLLAQYLTQRAIEGRMGSSNVR